MQTSWRVVAHDDGWAIACAAPLGLDLVFATITPDEHPIALVFSEQTVAERVAKLLNAPQPSSG